MSFCTDPEEITEMAAEMDPLEFARWVLSALSARCTCPRSCYESRTEIADLALNLLDVTRRNGDAVPS